MRRPEVDRVIDIVNGGRHEGRRELAFLLHLRVRDEGSGASVDIVPAERAGNTDRVLITRQGDRQGTGSGNQAGVVQAAQNDALSKDVAAVVDVSLYDIIDIVDGEIAGKGDPVFVGLIGLLA